MVVPDVSSLCKFAVYAICMQGILCKRRMLVILLVCWSCAVVFKFVQAVHVDAVLTWFCGHQVLQYSKITLVDKSMGMQ